jgi:hypothetical protein
VLPGYSRVGELEALTWGDVDEYEGRGRVSGAVAKTGQARWASQAAAWLGHSAQEHLRTHAHVMIDRTELDYASLLETCTDGVHSVLTRS